MKKFKMSLDVPVVQEKLDCHRDIAGDANEETEGAAGLRYGVEIDDGVQQTRRYKDAVMPDDGGESGTGEQRVEETEREERNDVLYVVQMASVNK